MRRTVIALLLTLAVALSACGSDTTKRSAAPGPTASGAAAQGPALPSPDKLPSQARSADDGGSSSGAKGSSGGSRTTAEPLPTAVPGFREAPLKVTMGRQCTVPGGPQTITIEATPNFELQWGTWWPNQSSTCTTGSCEVTKVPASGVYTKAFTVPPDMQTGPARTDVQVIGKINGEWAVGLKHPEWDIKTVC